MRKYKGEIATAIRRNIKAGIYPAPETFGAMSVSLAYTKQDITKIIEAAQKFFPEIESKK